MKIIFEILTLIYGLIAFFERKIFIKNISKDDLVLDVGSGDKPFWRADVIVDKYLEDDFQRATGPMIFDQKKIFIKADVEKLPFKDKVFDFVFCSHLLEHVENPEKAITELTRVAKKGYLEVPRAIIDLFWPFPTHLWFCEYTKGTLIFRQKEKEKNFFIQSTEQFGNKFLNNSLFKYLLFKENSSSVVTHYWKDKIKYEVIRSKSPYRYRYQKEIYCQKSPIAKFAFILYKVFYKIMVLLFYEKKKIDLNKILKETYPPRTYCRELDTMLN